MHCCRGFFQLNEAGRSEIYSIGTVRDVARTDCSDVQLSYYISTAIRDGCFRLGLHKEVQVITLARYVELVSEHVSSIACI